MSYSPISYMRWAKTAGADCEFFLSLSGMPPPPESWFEPISPGESMRYREAYGDPRIREAIAAHYGASPDQVLIAHGTSEANFLVCAALLETGDRVAVETPCYEPLVRVVEALGCTVVPIPRAREHHYQVLPEDVGKALDTGARLIILSNLHNPTGVALSEEVLQEAAERVAAAGAHLLVDEVYLDFMPKDRRTPAFSLGPAVISTSSLTKVYGLGPLRCGWAIAAPPLVSRAYDVRDHLGVMASGPATLLAAQALRQIDRLQELAHHRMREGRKVMDAFLERTPNLKWVAPDSGIMGLLELPPGIQDRPFCERMAREYHTLVTPGDFFGVPGTIRVGFGGDPASTAEGLKRLGRALNQQM